LIGRGHRVNLLQNQRSRVREGWKDQRRVWPPHGDRQPEIGPERVDDGCHDTIRTHEQNVCAICASDMPFVIRKSDNGSACCDRLSLHHGDLRKWAAEADSMLHARADAYPVEPLVASRKASRAAERRQSSDIELKCARAFLARNSAFDWMDGGRMQGYFS
jgi:hypothetical protein